MLSPVGYPCFKPAAEQRGKLHITSETTYVCSHGVLNYIPQLGSFVLLDVSIVLRCTFFYIVFCFLKAFLVSLYPPAALLFSAPFVSFVCSQIRSFKT